MRFPNPAELGAEAVVPQYETFSPANQDFLARLRTFCDSVLHTYLSTIADTADERNYLHVLYTAAITLRLPADFIFLELEVFLNDLTQNLELGSLTFQPCKNPSVLLDAIWQWDILA